MDGDDMTLKKNPYAPPDSNHVDSVQDTIKNRRRAGLGFRFIFWGAVSYAVGSMLMGLANPTPGPVPGIGNWISSTAAAAYFHGVRLLLPAGCFLIFSARIPNTASWLMLLCFGIQFTVVAANMFQGGELVLFSQLSGPKLVVFEYIQHSISASLIAVYMKQIATVIGRKSLVQLSRRIFAVFGFLLLTNPVAIVLFARTIGGAEC